MCFHIRLSGLSSSKYSCICTFLAGMPLAVSNTWVVRGLPVIKTLSLQECCWWLIKKYLWICCLKIQNNYFFSQSLKNLSRRKKILCYCHLSVIIWSEQWYKSQSSSPKPVLKVVSGKRIPSILRIYISIPVNILQTLPKQKAVLISFIAVC